MSRTERPETKLSALNYVSIPANAEAWGHRLLGRMVYDRDREQCVRWSSCPGMAARGLAVCLGQLWGNRQNDGHLCALDRRECGPVRRRDCLGIARGVFLLVDARANGTWPA